MSETIYHGFFIRLEKNILIIVLIWLTINIINITTYCIACNLRKFVVKRFWKHYSSWIVIQAQ